MHRRQVLALLGSAAGCGCLSGSRGGESTATTTDETTDGEPPELGVPDPKGCPSFDDSVKRVVCSPEADDDAPLVIDPAEQSGSLPRDEFAFELTNGTDATFELNFYAWTVWKRVDGQWYHVAPRFVNQPLMRLEPGDAHEWRLTVDNTDPDRPIPRASGTREVTVVGLGPGTYAFGTDGWFEGQSPGNNTGIAARFELDGEPLELAPTGVESVERDGETVVVRLDREETGALSRYAVDRVADPPTEPRRMIVEQVVRETPLRNALSYFEEGVERVELLAPDRTSPSFGVKGPRYRTYEDDTYRIETERVETTAE